MANFNPTRKCLENEHECYNSYGCKICVEEKIKFIACASYSPRMCNDNENFYKKISDYQFVVFKLLTSTKINPTFSIKVFLLSKDINLRKLFLDVGSALKERKSHLFMEKV